MGCHVNHKISCNQSAFILIDYIVLHLRGPIEQIYTHNEMSYLFNEIMITPSDISLSYDFH